MREIAVKEKIELEATGELSCESESIERCGQRQ
jgi:hypothetical protein